MNEHIIILIFVISCLLIASIGIYYLIKEGRKEIKGGRVYVNHRLWKFKEIIGFSEWYQDNIDEIWDNWYVFGIGYPIDEFAILLFKGDKKIIKRMRKLKMFI